MVVWESLSPALAKDTALLRRAYVVLCMLGHFYLHGAPKNSRSGSSDSESAHRKNFVPAPIAIPWLLVSKALGLKPVLSYASQILWNCAYNDISLLDDPLPSGQIRILETFTGDSSEVAFDISPARVELEGAVILKAILDVLATHFQGSDLIQSQSAVTLELLRIESALRRMKSHLLILKKDCDPFHFYWKLRPLISGSGPEGWTYELSGGSVINLQVGGSTAGSSSLLQALDSFLGLHLSDSQISFRRAMQEYMPQGHRLFCHGPDLLRISGLKLGHAYNSVVRGLKEFRDEHFRIVSLFIINQASKAQKNIENNPSFVEESSLKKSNLTTKPKISLTGTGGSDLARLLKGYRDSSQEALLDLS
ncbi:Indoleamine 2,3-dioxygenase [Pyrenochaeta sp. MPI-SDFR-AT-0127]|nr:Indoleamine 2,3-dioxygenase [Pyrenochaeta sp. MPI-SDFR-AT-0127]